MISDLRLFGRGTLFPFGSGTPPPPPLLVLSSSPLRPPDPFPAQIQTGLSLTTFELSCRASANAWPASAVDIELSLFAMQLADLAYASTEDELVRGLAALPSLGAHKLLHFSPQDRGGLPQWYLLSASAATYLVFRGTHGLHDISRDLLASPEAHGELQFHSGFLSGVRDDPEIGAQLRAHLAIDY